MFADHWQTTAAERDQGLPCDDLVPDGRLLTRGVDTTAGPATVFRWLCQLRVASYSYDWLDNRGRRSPRHLTEGLEHLEPGQEFMGGAFALIDFRRNEHLTLRSGGRAFGDVAVTYAAPPGRILLRIRIRNPGRAPERALRDLILPVGDLIMARRQLLNLAELAETEQRRAR